MTADEGAARRKTAPNDDAGTHPRELLDSVDSTADHRQSRDAGVYGASTVRRKRRSNAELETVNEAIVEAIGDEHPVTLRGVFYRVVSMGAVEKSESGYRLVGRQLLKLRRDGTVPYGWITDGTRWMRKPASYRDLDEMLHSAAASYRRALWEAQNAQVIVLSEKDAISGVIYPVTSEWDVELGIVRGYSSETFAYSIAEDIAATWKTVYVYQLGDHDPSGVDAWRSFEATVRGFGLGGAAVFERLAVTPEQIVELRLETRPTKGTDVRARGFVGESVEVDAIPPSVLRRIVEDAIKQHINPEVLRLTLAVENEEREGLYRIARGGAR